jgi:thiamine biosynthesis lipoprotein
MSAERRFAIMGSTAHVVVTGGPSGLAGIAERRLNLLEDRWSRFRPASEVCQLQASRGAPLVVSDDTFVLVERCLAAWSRTGGAFDPTILPALEAAGYDDDFAAVASRVEHPRTPVTGGAAPGMHGIELLPAVSAVVLPVGVELDGGGIAKGLAADIVTAELLAAGAEGAMVNVGGDIRVRGAPPSGSTWSIAVAHPTVPGTHLLRLGLEDGAVATSSRLRRRWTIAGRERHHLLDPRTGEPTGTPVVAVTAIAAEGWWAEAVTKQVFVEGPATRPQGALIAVVMADGRIACSPELEAVAA